MYFIKHFLFLIFLSSIYCIFGYYLFSDIFYSNNIIITYGINPFNVCVENPELWKYIKVIFFFTYISSSFIISNIFYNIIKKIFIQIKNFFNFSKLNYLKNFFNNLKYISNKFKNILKNRRPKKSNLFFPNNYNEKINDKFPISNINSHKESNFINNILKLFIGYNYSSNSPIYLTEKSLYQNILVTGTIGTGKTSSAMYPFTKQLIEYSCKDIKSKIGMLILDVKGNYYIKVVEFAKNVGRENDLIIISLNGKYKYNPLHKPNLKPSVLANRLKTILLLFSPNNSESYWLDKVEQILTECIKLCRLYNNGYVTFEEIHKLISIDDYYLNKIDILRKKFIKNDFSTEDIYNLISSLNFFQKEFFTLDQRTLSILKSEITRITNIFVSDYEIYNTFNPKIDEINFLGFEELIKDGKIVVLNMNISEYRNLSKIIATYLKLDFQTEIMTRLSNNFELSQRTVAFISDEYHEYCTSSDSEFYSQSREAKCINIVSTQSYTSLLNSINNKYSVEVIIQNLVNKFWFRTDDIFTIENAQKQIGKEDKEKQIRSISENAQETNYSYISNSLNSSNSNISESISTQLTYEYIYDTKFFSQELENFCALSFLSNGNKIIEPQKVKLKPYFEK